MEVVLADSEGRESRSVEGEEGEDGKSEREIVVEGMLIFWKDSSDMIAVDFAERKEQEREKDWSIEWIDV